MFFCKIISKRQSYVLLAFLCYIALILYFGCPYCRLADWRNVEIVAALIGCVPVSATLLFQAYTYRKENQANREIKAQSQFQYLCENYQRAKDTLFLQLENLGTSKGEEVIENVIRLFSDVVDILRSDYTYDDGVHRDNLRRHIDEAQHLMELCGGTPELEFELEQNLLNAEAALKREIRYDNICRLLGITHSKWQELHTLSQEKQEEGAARIVLINLQGRLQRYNNSLLSLDSFLHHRKGFYKFTILSLFGSSEIDYIKLWRMILKTSSSLEELQKIFNTSTL